MVGEVLYRLSILVAIIGGTAAGLLSFLFRNVLRKTPFGTAVALLSFTLTGVILYHVVLFLWGVDSVALDAVRSAVHTIIAVFLWLAVAMHRQVQRNATR